MRIVLDTNVLVSALLNETGAPAQVVDLCIAGDLELAVDARILAEYREVLGRPELALNAADVEALLDLAAHAEHVVAAPLPLTLPDADDLPFLEVAVAAAADALVTGNAKHFTSPQGRVDVPVLSPRALLDKLGGGG